VGSRVADELRSYADTYRIAVSNLTQNRNGRDEAKRNLSEKEAELYVAGITAGDISGKNAETRDAEALLKYRSDPAWQKLTDELRKQEISFALAQDAANLALMDLKVQAILVNAEIAETGARALLAETSLGNL